MDIKGYEDYYQIFQDGKIFSKHTNRFLKPSLRNNSYLRINLWKNGKQKNFDLHRLIALHYISNPLNLPDVDHEDRNKLNIDISNLRWTTKSQNNRNVVVPNTSSKYTGVCWFKRDSKWLVYIKINGKTKHIGCYKSEWVAAVMYNRFIIQNIHLDTDLKFCNLNVIPKKIITIKKKDDLTN